jgi:hypothetical protein
MLGERELQNRCAVHLSEFEDTRDNPLWKLRELRDTLCCARTGITNNTQANNTQASALVRDHVSSLEPALLGATPHADAD